MERTNKASFLWCGNRGEILLGLCLFVANWGYSQVLFSNRYTMHNVAAQFDALCLKDTMLVTSGIVADTAGLAPAYRVKNMLGFFNLNGELLYSKEYTGKLRLNYGTFFNTLINTSDGGFGLAGYTQDTIMQVLFMRFDSAGNLQLVTEYGDTNTVFLNGYSLVELNKGFLIAGERSIQTGPSDYHTNVHVLNIDFEGKIRWWKIYDHPTLTQDFPSLLQLTDTTVLLGYVRSNELLGAKWESSHTELMVIDTLGNIIKEWEDPNDSSHAPSGLSKSKDGGFLYCGRFKFSQPKAYDYFNTQGQVTKLDSAFNLKWRRIMGDTSGETLFYRLKELTDGSIIAVGANNAYGDTSYTHSGWLVKLSADGDSIWSRKYRSIITFNSISEIYDLEILDNGDIIGAGISSDFSKKSQEQQGWLIRLDSMGCLIPGCDTLTLTGIKETPEETVGVKVYPNPAKDLVYVLMKKDQPVGELSFSVYDVTGKLLLTQPHAATDITYLLHTTAFAKGLYFIEVMNGDKVAARRKFVKE